MTRRSARTARRASRPLAVIAVFPALAALATLAACTDAPQPTGPARPGRPTLIQVATGPVVTSMADDGDGTCTDAGVNDGCTLREAIAFASSGAVITFGPGVTGTITLAQGELSIDKTLTVSGPGAKSLAVSGNQASRVFNITGGVAVTLAGLTVTGGADGDGGGIANDGGTRTGASGLQNLGGGYYQLNWQAPKSYAGSCKTPQLNLSEGSPRTALFQFTK